MLDSIRWVKPLKTDITTIRAALPIAIPTTEMREIQVITSLVFLAKRYLPAILLTRPTLCYFLSSSSMCSA